MIEIKDVSFTYPDGKEAIEDLSLRIDANECVGILGANGAGKSTLLMLLMGVLTGNKGVIQIDGLPVNKKNLSEIRKRAGVVFQNPDDQLFMPTVYEDIAFGPRNYGYTEAEVENAVAEALEIVGIKRLRDRKSYRLSGGEKRSVAISTVLAMKPKVLILDEPSAFLDPKSRRKMIEMINELPQTKVITTHDLEMVLDVCQRVIIMAEGKIIADGDPRELLRDEALMESCGLEVPAILKYEYHR